jgi:hypothetical protein
MKKPTSATGTAATLLGALALLLATAVGAAAQTPEPPEAPRAPGAQERQERMERMREVRAERAERMQELRGERTPPAPGIERILEQRARLGLTDQQVTALNTLRLQVLETRQARIAAAGRVRSDLAAGEITRAEAVARMEEFRSGPEAADVRSRVEEILTEEQRTQLEESRRAAVGREGVRRAPMAPGARGGQRVPRGPRVP